MNERFDVAGRTVVITGGARGSARSMSRNSPRPAPGSLPPTWTAAAAKSVVRGARRTRVAGPWPRHRHRERGLPPRPWRRAALETLRQHRCAHQQCLVDERAAAALLAGNSGGGVGPGDGGQSARHVSLLPCRISRHAGCAGAARSSTSPLARVWEGTPNRLHYTTSKAGVIGLYPRARARGRRVRHHRQCRHARHDAERDPGAILIGEIISPRASPAAPSSACKCPPISSVPSCSSRRRRATS